MKTLRYYAEFFSSKNKKYRLEIRTELLYGAQEIKLTSTPITVEYGSGGRLHFPTLMSQASINVITHGPIIDLFTGSNQGVDIRIIDLDSGKTDWFGYFSPNTYSSNYNTDLDALQLEAIDTLASLENIRYNYLNGSSSEFVTFKDVLLYILDKADPGRIINNVYMQKTLRLSADATTNIWSDLIIQEVNFYDELDEAMNLQDVLKELMKFLGMTIIQYQDSYYIIDHAFIKADKSEFFFHNRTTGVETSVNIPIVTKNLYSDIGLHGSNANLSIGDLYNKQTIRANRLNVQSVIPDVMDDDDLVNQNVDPSKYHETIREVGKEYYTLLTAFLKSARTWWYLKPTIGGDTSEMEVTPDNIYDLNNAAFWQNADYYKSKDSEGNVLNEPASLNWKRFLTLFSRPIQSYTWYNIKYLGLNLNKTLVLRGGYFILDINYKMSTNALAHDILPSVTGGIFDYLSEYKGRFENTMFPCRLAIGSYYYDGESFVSYNDFNLKISREYFREGVSKADSKENRTWYKYIDGYGYRRYVSESVYNALPPGTDKSMGNYTLFASHKVFGNIYIIFWFLENGERIYIEESYYYECILRDRFFLVHTNLENDKIFDTEKSLTNTVSYKMNLIDSEAGQAIKLPEDGIISGGLIFDLYRPNQLGISPASSAFPDGSPMSSTCMAFHISNISLKYTTVSSNQNQLQAYNDDTDMIYSNIIDSNNVQEADDIELYINTYKDRAAYSSVVVQRNGEYDFLDTLYSEIEGGDYMAEDFLINKLCDHYEEKRYIYENDLNRKFDFLTKIYENSLDATMLVSSMSIDYATDSCRVRLIEP